MLCGLVVGGSAQAADLEVFKPSSGNIVCELDNGEVDCFIKSGPKPAPRRNDVCHIGDPTSNRVQLFATGIAAPLLCAGDPGPHAKRVAGLGRVRADRRDPPGRPCR
jgi:hypothetical protein